MAYDGATGTAVLFGGLGETVSRVFADTWTWDGSTWTQQHPATSLPALLAASMADDAATSTAVLFGGYSDSIRHRQTWTWDGSTWTQQHPATAPSSRLDASMAHDAATGTAVLFGGYSPGSKPHSTWAWG